MAADNAYLRSRKAPLDQPGRSGMTYGSGDEEPDLDPAPAMRNSWPERMRDRRPPRPAICLPWDGGN